MRKGMTESFVSGDKCVNQVEEVLSNDDNDQTGLDGNGWLQS